MPETITPRSCPRREDERFLRGYARFTADLEHGGQLHAALVRSDHPHAELLGIDSREALALPGVVAVHTATDLAEDGLGALPCHTDIGEESSLVIPPRPALAWRRARHVGDPIALVLATSADAARTGAEQVAIDYGPLAAVVDPAAALAPGAPQLWTEAPGNLAFHFRRGDREATDRALGDAAHVVELELHNNRVSALPIEPRAGLAEYDAASGQFTLTATAQGLHAIRRQIAGPVFGLPEDRFRLVAPDVGGGFGLKNFLYPEWVLLLWAARKHARAVKWVGSRGEDLIGAAHGRDVHAWATLALDTDGRFLALEARLIANLGAYLSGGAPNVTTKALPTAMGGIYSIPHVYMESRGVFTNTATVDAYRGAGKPEANYIIERLIDVAARRCGFDPVALRERNAIATFPHRSAFGMHIDGGRFAANIRHAAKLADRDAFERRRDSSAQRGCLRGLGVGCFLETARGAPSEGAEIRFLDDGTVELRVGTESHGQGHETAYLQIASSRLGLPFDGFRYIQADTARVAMGNGHGGARSMHMGGAALVKAIDGVLEKSRTIAAQLLQSEPSLLTFEAGSFTVAASDRQVHLLEVARAARELHRGATSRPGGLDVFARIDNAPFTFPNGCHVAEVEIDPVTGVVRLLRYVCVDDYGALINPRLTEGQVQGGVAQGIGQALMEHVVYDPDSAQPITGSLMDYAIPSAADLPGFEITLEGVPTDANPLGVKGSGQAGAIAAPQAVMNAIVDALCVLGIEHLDMPATSERIWRAIRDAERRRE